MNDSWEVLQEPSTRCHKVHDRFSIPHGIIQYSKDCTHNSEKPAETMRREGWSVRWGRLTRIVLIAIARQSRWIRPKLRPPDCSGNISVLEPLVCAESLTDHSQMGPNPPAMVSHEAWYH